MGWKSTEAEDVVAEIDEEEDDDAHDIVVGALAEVDVNAGIEFAVDNGIAPNEETGNEF